MRYSSELILIVPRSICFS